jgi:hypothetical protein
MSAVQGANPTEPSIDGLRFLGGNMGQHRGQSRARRLPPQEDVLAALPDDVLMRILECMDDFQDCAHFSIACPPLGLMAIRARLPRFCDPLFAIAMAKTVRPIDERIVRKYAADSCADAAHFGWLRKVSSVWINAERKNGRECWWLSAGSVRGALLRGVMEDGSTQHYEGEPGVERVIRKECPCNAMVAHFEGARGCERLVRQEYAGRAELPDGSVAHFEGERGAERMVRAMHPNGHMAHYEGQRGAEHLVRIELSYGRTIHYEGARGAERMVRMAIPVGSVCHSDWL